MNEAVLHSGCLIIELLLNYELCQVDNDVALILFVESQSYLLHTPTDIGHCRTQTLLLTRGHIMPYLH